jgi:hypothetical protein
MEAHARRQNACHWCDGSFKFVPYVVNGNGFCSATCVQRWQYWMQKQQLSLQLQPMMPDKEGDACTCHNCRDP